MPQRIKCGDVSYRKGYIEVTPGIHDGCINLETWNVRAEVDIAKHDIRDEDFPADAVTGSTEIELNLVQARALIGMLEQAISTFDS